MTVLIFLIFDIKSDCCQVSVNFLDMRLPSQGSNGVCEAWVQLEEPEDDHLGSLIGGDVLAFPVII